MVRVAVAAFFALLLPTLILAQTVLPAPTIPAEVAVECQKEKAAAAARGAPDVANTVDDPTGIVLKDTCVAAILNPATPAANPTNPASYICVGKRARIDVTVAGLISNLNVPDPSVPAGTCSATACTHYVGLTCIPASKQISISDMVVRFFNGFTGAFNGLTGLNGFPETTVPMTVGIRG